MLGQGLWPRSHFVEVVNFAFLTKPSFVIWDVVLFVNMAPFGYRQVFFRFKGSSEKNCRLILVVLSRRNKIWFTISQFWVLFFNFEWTLWYYVDFFFGFCYIILYWKLETDYPMRDGSRCNYVKYTSFPISFDLYFILFITKERLSCKMMFLTVQTTDNRLNYNL